jgi:hypothetical protein
MKKTYEKPTLVKAGNLPLVTALIVHENGGGNGFLFSLAKER